MAAVALAIRFALELNAIAAVAIWGFRAGDGGIAGAIYAGAAVVVLLVNWAWFIAPRSTRSPIPVRWRTLAGAAVMLLAAALLAAAGEPLPAVVFAVVVVADTAALFALGASDQDWPILPPPAHPEARPTQNAAVGDGMARGTSPARASANDRPRRASSGSTKRRRRR